MTVAVGVMARAPSSGGKTRLAPHLSPERLAALRRALVSDTLVSLEGVPDLTIFVTPDGGETEIRRLTSRRCVAQRGTDLGARMLSALQDLLSPRVSDTAAVLVGSDIPLLTADHVREASALLGSAKAPAERLVLGPAEDGGYYLIGMRQPWPQLFEGIAWGTGSVLTDTLRTADRTGVDARLIRSGYDVDTIEDLRRVEHDLTSLPPDICPNLRRWLSEA